MHIADPRFRSLLFPEVPATARMHPPGGGAALAPTTHAASGRSAERQAALRIVAAEVMQALGGRVGALQHEHPIRAHNYGPADAVGVGAVAHALRAALSDASSSEGDPVAALLGQVESGLGSAQDELAKLGFDAADITAAVSEFRSRAAGIVGALAETPADSGVSLSAVGAERLRKERGALELVTQDGDVVRIRFHSREAERVSIAALETGDTTAWGARVQTFSATRVKVDVHGELDAGELEAIRNFLGEADKVASDFFAGDAEAAFAAGAALQFDHNEIARYALKFSFSERVELQALQRGTAPGTASAPASSSTAPGLTVEPSTSMASRSAPAGTLSTAPAQPTQPASLPSAQVPASTDRTAHSPSPLDTIRMFVQRVLKLAETPLSVGQVEVSFAFKLRIVVQAIEAAQPSAQSSAGSAAAREVLGEAASQASATQPALQQAA